MLTLQSGEQERPCHLEDRKQLLPHAKSVSALTLDISASRTILLEIMTKRL